MVKPWGDKGYKEPSPPLSLRASVARVAIQLLNLQIRIISRIIHIAVAVATAGNRSPSKTFVFANEISDPWLEMS